MITIIRSESKIIRRVRFPTWGIGSILDTLEAEGGPE